MNNAAVCAALRRLSPNNQFRLEHKLLTRTHQLYLLSGKTTSLARLRLLRNLSLMMYEMLSDLRINKGKIKYHSEFALMTCDKLVENFLKENEDHADM